MSQVLGAFGLLYFTVLQPGALLGTYEPFIYLFIYLFNFSNFFWATVNRM